MIRRFKEKSPRVHETAFVADTAMVIGDVVIEEGVSIWYGTVVRGDTDLISIGKGTNIQDNSVLHSDKDLPTIIGEGVTVGHKAIVHACTIGDNTLIGMGSTILDGAVIGSNVLVGAGSLVTPGKKIPDGTLVKGAPAQVVRALTELEIEGLKRSAAHYTELGKEHKYETYEVTQS